MSLSGGQKQRVAIASAILAGKEKILPLRNPQQPLSENSCTRLHRFQKHFSNECIVGAKTFTAASLFRIK